MVTPILKCNSSNNPLIISTGIGDFEFSHSLGQELPVVTGRFRAGNLAIWSSSVCQNRTVMNASKLYNRDVP